MRSFSLLNDAWSYCICYSRNVNDFLRKKTIPSSFYIFVNHCYRHCSCRNCFSFQEWNWWNWNKTHWNYIDSNCVTFYRWVIYHWRKVIRWILFRSNVLCWYGRTFRMFDIFRPSTNFLICTLYNRGFVQWWSNWKYARCISWNERISSNYLLVNRHKFIYCSFQFHRSISN